MMARMPVTMSGKRLVTQSTRQTTNTAIARNAGKVRPSGTSRVATSQ